MSPVSLDAHDAVSASIVTRPPVLFLACLILGLILDRLLPLPLGWPAAPLASWATGGGLVVLGLAIAVAGTRNFSRATTPFRSNEPVRALVTTGLHRFSRNPIYIGMLLIYFGIGVAARGGWVLVLTVPLAATLHFWIVAREEAYLERRFGDAYREYKARVRRWL